MSTAIRVNTSQEGPSADLPEIDKNEFNEEIYRHLTQLHQEQMQQRSRNSPSNRLPLHVQQALNLNTAFLSFSQNLVEGFIADQTECNDCQQMYKEQLLIPAVSDLQTQVLDATEFLDRIVDAHSQHADTEHYEYCMAKLSVNAILGQLHASKRLRSRMEDLTKEIWGPIEPFNSKKFALDEMLFLEWKMVLNSLKTLYHHYLYFLKCVTAAEDIWNELDREAVIAQVVWEKEKFNRTASFLSSHFGQQNGEGTGALETVPTGLPAISRALGERGMDANSPQSDSELTGSWEKVGVSSIQPPKGLMSGNGVMNTSTKRAEDACSQLLESLSNVTFNECQSPELSILGLSDMESTPSHDSSNLADDAEGDGLSQQRKVFANISQSWVAVSTNLGITDPKSEGDTANICQDGADYASESSKRSSDNEKGKRPAAQRGQQYGTHSSHKRLDRDIDGQENEDDNDDDDQDRKRRRDASVTELVADSRGFACPYYKSNPEKHPRKACSSTNFPTIHRLKEHLYRTHRMPIHCPRCRHMFLKKEEVLEHQREPIPCELREVPIFVGFDEVQEERLRSRKQTTKDDSKKWEETYRILFPENTKPFPTFYHDTRNPSIDQSQIKRRVHRELVQYNEYQREILPVLIESKLSMSNETGDFIGVQFTTILDECLSETLKDYQLSGADGRLHTRDENSVYEVDRPTTPIQEAGNFTFSPDLSSNPFSFSAIPRYGGSEMVSFEVPDFVNSLNPEYGSGVGDTLFMDL